jgi:hypothetical protein
MIADSKVIPAIWATLIEAAAMAGPEVEYAVRSHLTDIGYDLDREAQRIAERAPKAWRWIGEMEESAKTMRELGLPAGFSEAAVTAYTRIARRLYAGRSVSGCYGVDVSCEHEVIVRQSVARVVGRDPERDPLPCNGHVGVVANFSRFRRNVHCQVNTLVVRVGERAGYRVAVEGPPGQRGQSVPDFCLA